MCVGYENVLLTHRKLMMDMVTRSIIDTEFFYCKRIKNSSSKALLD